MSTKLWDKSVLKEVDNLLLLAGKAALPGVYTLEAYIHAVPQPIGMVWYCRTGNTTLEILNSWVNPRIRRQGVRTKIHKYMLTIAGIDTIVTLGSTKLSLPWLKKMGFKKQESGDWVLTLKWKK